MDFVTPNITNLLTTAVGFILFVWVLAKFAWGPILNLLDARRQKIEGDYAAAEKNLADSEQLKGEFESEARRHQGPSSASACRKRSSAAKASPTASSPRRTPTPRPPWPRRSRTSRSRPTRPSSQLRDSVVAMAIGAAEKVIGTKMDDAMHRKLITEYIDELDKTGSGA